MERQEIPELPGFLRSVDGDGKVSYLSPTGVKLPSARKVDKYLAREQRKGAMMGMSSDHFDFSRVVMERGEVVRRKSSEEVFEEVGKSAEEEGKSAEKVGRSAKDKPTEEDKPTKLEAMVKRLTIDPKVKLNHVRECDKVRLFSICSSICKRSRSIFLFKEYLCIFP